MNIRRSAAIVLQDCMGISKEETVLIVTDTAKYEIADAIFQEARPLAREALLMVMEEREVSGQEPPAPIAAAMKGADVVICVTEKSLTHTDARIEAAACGVRIGTMPGITKDLFLSGAITADFNKVLTLTEKLTALLTAAKTARIEKDGCVLAMSLADRKGIPSPGVYKTKGSCGNLPSGEAYIAPLESSAEGEVVIDGSMVGVGRLSEPLKAVIRGGKLVDLQGKDSAKLSVLFQKPENAVVAELGIGTNEKARLCGIILEDEKVYGTVHIAFGTNTSFGGNNKGDCHLDGVILNPDLYLDDQAVILGGKFVISQ